MLGVEVDWLVESNKGVFSDFVRLVVERFDRGVPALGGWIKWMINPYR